MSAARTGADAFLGLIRAISQQTTADFLAEDDGAMDDADVRNYVALASIVDASLRENFVNAGSEHRQGFVRAIADLLAIHVDGALPGEDWDPLLSSEAAFRAPELATAVIRRAAQ